MNPQAPEENTPIRRGTQTGLATLLFTDIVGSTQLKQDLGDVKGVELIQLHHSLIRETLSHFSEAKEISTSGDSFFLVFTKPSDAVRFSLTLQKMLREGLGPDKRQLRIRIGIHLGEVVVEADATQPNDLYGTQVDTCSRVMSLGHGDQILLTRSAFDSARQVLKGEDNNLRWLNHGAYSLKGVDESLEICEVGEEGQAALKAPEEAEKAKRLTSHDEEQVLGWRPAIGQMVPNSQWELLENLGEGGFGEVWLGRHRKLHQERVFKFCFQFDRVRSLKREVTLFRLLQKRAGDHPNIVSIREVFFDEPPYYIVMDYAAGQDLKAWCEERNGAARVSEQDKLEIIAQVAEALQAAHDASVIHRDVKPGNILVERSPSNKRLQVKLTDFGIGQVMNEELLSGVTQSGFTQTMLSSSSTQAGTQLYLAPELLAGQPATPRSDIYSLGVVLFQLLVNDLKRPVTGDWAKEISDALLRDDLEHCFAWKPEERFAGPIQLARHLRELPNRRAELAQEEARIKAERKAAFRNGVIRTAAIAAVLVIGFSGLAFYAFKQEKNAKEQSQRAEASLVIAQEEKARAHEEKNNALQQTYASDMNLARNEIDVGNYYRARKILDRHRPKNGQLELRGWEWRFLWQACHADAIGSLGKLPYSIMALEVSSDGTLVAAGSEEVSGVRLFDLESQEERAVLADDLMVSYLAFHPTMNRLVVAGEVGKQEYEIQLIAIDQREVVWKSTGDRRFTGGLNFTPDGERILIMEGDYHLHKTGKPDILYVINALTGQRLAQYPLAASSWFWNSKNLVVSPNGQQCAYTLTDGMLRSVEIDSGKSIWRADAEINHLEPKFQWPVFSSDGRYIAGPHADNIVFIDTVTGQKTGEILSPHAGAIQGLSFVDGDKSLVSVSFDQTLKIWDVESGQLIGRQIGPRGEIWRLAAIPNSQLLVTGNKTGDLTLWDRSLPTEHRNQFRIPDALRVWKFGLENDRLISVNSSGHVSEWNGPPFDSPTELFKLEEGFNGVALSQDVENLAVFRVGTGLENWSLKQRTRLSNTKPSIRDVKFITFTGKGLELLLVSPENQVSLIDVSNGEELSAGELGKESTRHFLFELSPDGTMALSVDNPKHGSHISRLRLWKLNPWSEIAYKNIESPDVWNTAFSSDGTIIGVAGRPGMLQLLSVPDLVEIGEFKEHRGGSRSCAFSPDMSRMVINGQGPPASNKLWDWNTGLEVLTMPYANNDYRGYVRFAPTGNLIAVQEAWNLHIWHAPSMDAIEQFEALRGTN